MISFKMRFDLDINKLCIIKSEIHTPRKDMVFTVCAVKVSNKLSTAMTKPGKVELQKSSIYFVYLSSNLNKECSYRISLISKH